MAQTMKAAAVRRFRPEVRPGEWVVISGVVLAVDIYEKKLALARKLGAEVTVNGKPDDAVEQVQMATDGGVHEPS